jgi:hypothetical protein
MCSKKIEEGETGYIGMQQFNNICTPSILKYFLLSLFYTNFDHSVY